MLLVSQLFHKRGVFMSDATSQIKRGVFPKFSDTSFYTTFYNATKEIVKDFDHDAPHIPDHYSEFMKNDLDNIMKIKDSYPKEYNSYLEKFLLYYNDKVNAVVCNCTIYAPYGHNEREELYLTVSLTSDSKLKVSIRPWNGDMIYEQEFAGTVSIPNVKKEVSNFLSQQVKEKALRELARRYV